jgi:hypothetical protein
MKGMQKIQRGSGFRGCADYLFDHDDGRVVGGNMVGTTPRALAMEFGVTRRQRPDIAKPVWHNSLRLPHDERVEITDEKWREIGDDYMRGMGFSDQHPRVYVLHEPGHIHILASRVALDGSLYLGRNENLKSTALIQRLEQLHGLTVTKGPKRTTKGRIAPPEVRRTRQNERRRYERLEDTPPREWLQQLVAEAAQGKPSASEFVARLQSKRVSVWPNVASTGRLSGFSFGFEGVAFTGQQLGAKFTWPRLQKAGVHYDPARDMDALLAARPAVDPAEFTAKDQETAPVPEVEVEAVTVSRKPEVEVDDRPRPALAEGLDLTPEELEVARRLEEEAREFEEIQAAMDAPNPDPGPRHRGPRM